MEANYALPFTLGVVTGAVLTVILQTICNLGALP
jgi:hypothetical protein